MRDFEQELESGNVREVSLKDGLSGLYISSINIRAKTVNVNYTNDDDSDTSSTI